MTTPPVYPPKPRPGDQVAVISPSAGSPGQFPLPYELGLRRLREEFGLVPVEYPATRLFGSTPQQRAADIHAAFADPQIKAVIATIGGEDQITVLPLLDKELIRANPKPFFGYSDNTNLLLFLRNLGIVSYHGASVMVELGRPGALHPLTAQSVRAALFDSGAYELRESPESGDVGKDWGDPATFASEPLMEPAEGWIWHNADRVVEGLGWGGNLEILAWMLMADREIRPVGEYAGQVLYLETSEELPSADEVYRILRNMGERGLLRQFPALLMARAKSWSFAQPLAVEQKAAYRKAQREAVLRALATYAPDTVAVFDVDFGHTDPQLVIPCGGRIRVDGPARRITVEY
ncbi:muramoyltetrapeptide carboxypeptidase LdcA involved in peptidoglycan recycling [Kitasatospora sp. MAA4]|uniref:S66 family peptidase n=1 Tax=Kitasatospora sp. MAA4 TaxID=3035093 RepID=UPI002476067D|nr:LD-carboxypeptidase [Kitasatospora sp. MAA4]MDH6136773.1 muramoyltetrapeptide carboxypeptidase LdcA involved in peptidoglycan recycling [Kitasatospora sp. MAA4]